MPAKAEPIVHIEDDRFVVTEWRFTRGQKQDGTGMAMITSSCP